MILRRFLLILAISREDEAFTMPYYFLHSAELYRHHYNIFHIIE